ncbi:MAG: XRE family transcriptional regulator [Coprococcus eutactus]
MKTEVSISERLKDLRVEKKAESGRTCGAYRHSKSASAAYELDTPREMKIAKILLPWQASYKVSVDYLLGRTEHEASQSAPFVGASLE